MPGLTAVVLFRDAECVQDAVALSGPKHYLRELVDILRGNDAGDVGESKLLEAGLGEVDLAGSGVLLGAEDLPGLEEQVLVVL